MSKIEEIKNNLDIVDVIGKHLNLSKKGQNYWAMCPFHDDTNPSMSISPDKQIFKCFVCGAGGDAIKFVSDFEKISFKEAMAKLAEKAGVEYKMVVNSKPIYNDQQQKIIDILKDATLFFQNAILTEAGEIALKYISNRGLDQETMNRFSIGYAPVDDSLIRFLEQKGYDKALMINASLMTQQGRPFQSDRLIFPIKNKHGDIVAFSGRTMNDKAIAKYINSIDSIVFKKSKTLYNYSDSQHVIRKEKEVYVLEGYMDVIALWRVGIENAVAIMGTALTNNHIPLLRGIDVVLMLDGDKAGLNATIKSIKALMANKLKTLVVNNPSDQDADELLEEGDSILKEVLLNRSTALDFVVQMHNKKYSIINPETNEEYLSSIVKYLNYATPIEKDFYVNKISEIRKISKDIVSDRIIVVNQSDTQNVFIRKAPPKKPVSIKENITSKLFKKRNYEFEMIHSMLTQPELIEIYADVKPVHSDVMIQQIGKYLIQYTKKIVSTPPSSDMKRKMALVKENSIPVKGPEAFREILTRVTKSSLNAEKENNKLKLKKVSNPEERIALLEANKILSKKIKEL